MFSIQPLSGRKGDEKLGAVAIGARVGHGQDAGPRVLQLIVQLVSKLPPVDTGAPSSCACGISP